MITSNLLMILQVFFWSKKRNKAQQAPKNGFVAANLPKDVDTLAPT